MWVDVEESVFQGVVWQGWRWVNGSACVEFRQDNQIANWNLLACVSVRCKKGIFTVKCAEVQLKQRERPPGGAWSSVISVWGDQKRREQGGGRCKEGRVKTNLRWFYQDVLFSGSSFFFLRRHHSRAILQFQCLIAKHVEFYALKLTRFLFDSQILDQIVAVDAAQIYLKFLFLMESSNVLRVE